MSKAVALAALKKAGWNIDDDGAGDFYDGYEYSFYKDKTTTTHRGSYGFPYEEAHYSGYLSFATSSATYCCGLPELGHYFKDRRDKNKITTKDVGLCLDYIKANEKTGYLRVTSTSRRVDTFWNNAFKVAGFKKRISLPSKHGDGKYKVYMWEWWDVKRHKDA